MRFIFFLPCKTEVRILITLDLDFLNVLLYPPKDSSGIILLRSLCQSIDCITDLVRKLRKKLKLETSERSEKGNRTTTTSPFTNLAKLHLPQA